MGFFTMLILASIFSAGALTLITASAELNGRFPIMRGFSTEGLRTALMKAAAFAGKRRAGLRTTGKRERIHKELYAALSVLRNHASAEDGAGSSMTTDHILEQFAQTDGILRPVYAAALRLLRTGRRAEAAEYFTAAADTELARDFILLVFDWDAVSPHKLKKTISAFQNALKETRTTELLRKTEIMSDLVYLPVIAGVLVVFINFIFVAYFAEQRELLAELFF